MCDPKADRPHPTGPHGSITQPTRFPHGSLPADAVLASSNLEGSVTAETGSAESWKHVLERWRWRSLQKI